MLWAGAATLTIRGSRKSSAGKTLERAFLRAGLTVLGLEEGEDFWLNMQNERVGERLAEPPSDTDRIAAAVNALPDGLFISGLLPP